MLRSALSACNLVDTRPKARRPWWSCGEEVVGERGAAVVGEGVLARRAAEGFGLAQRQAEGVAEGALAELKLLLEARQQRRHGRVGLLARLERGEGVAELDHVDRLGAQGGGGVLQRGRLGGEQLGLAAQAGEQRVDRLVAQPGGGEGLEGAGGAVGAPGAALGVVAQGLAGLA